MKNFTDIEEFKTIDELLDWAEDMYGPGTFVLVGRMRKRNMGAFDQDVAGVGETVRWPGEGLHSQAQDTGRAKAD